MKHYRIITRKEIKYHNDGAKDVNYSFVPQYRRFLAWEDLYDRKCRFSDDEYVSTCLIKSEGYLTLQEAESIIVRHKAQIDRIKFKNEKTISTL